MLIYKCQLCFISSSFVFFYSNECWFKNANFVFFLIFCLLVYLFLSYIYFLRLGVWDLKLTNSKLSDRPQLWLYYLL